MFIENRNKSNRKDFGCKNVSLWLVRHEMTFVGLECENHSILVFFCCEFKDKSTHSEIMCCKWVLAQRNYGSISLKCSWRETYSCFQKEAEERRDKIHGDDYDWRVFIYTHLNIRAYSQICRLFSYTHKWFRLRMTVLSGKMPAVRMHSSNISIDHWRICTIHIYVYLKGHATDWVPNNLFMYYAWFVLSIVFCWNFSVVSYLV